MARSLNKVQLIGNLTRDPELRYTPTGSAVCTIGLATSRTWTTDTGEKKEDTQFHRLIAWNKLAELCSQLLAKGRKAYFEGRIAYRKYTDKNGVEQNVTEIIIDDMLILDSKRTEGGYTGSATSTSNVSADKSTETAEKVSEPSVDNSVNSDNAGEAISGEEVADDIPF